MSEEASALSTIHPPSAAQGDYQSICAALMQTERGRWFLEEYARRNRSADTQLLLAAIGRIEAVVCAERNLQAPQGFRSDLLEMAKAITRTRAEVADIRADAAADAESVPPESEAAAARPQSRPGDVFAAAERIRDVTWAMRGHSFDPSTCEQLEQLAASILSASALRDPTDQQAERGAASTRPRLPRGKPHGRSSRRSTCPWRCAASTRPARVACSAPPRRRPQPPSRPPHAPPQPCPSCGRPNPPPLPQPPIGDPLAALKAMSDDELIALFS
ncbi:MAG TPA: hypothetical protein VGI22_26995 [Xanthobacteraceae bacterium]|jgi:hypothetical protein